MLGQEFSFANKINDRKVGLDRVKRVQLSMDKYKQDSYPRGFDDCRAATQKFSEKDIKTFLDSTKNGFQIDKGGSKINNGKVQAAKSQNNYMIKAYYNDYRNTNNLLISRKTTGKSAKRNLDSSKVMSELEQYKRLVEIKERKIKNVNSNKGIDEIVEEMCFDVMSSYQDDTMTKTHQVEE